MIRRIVLVGSLAIVAISVLALLGGNDKDDDLQLEPVRGTPDPAAELPDDWSAVHATAIGVEVGAPPEWRESTAEGVLTLRSPGRAAVISISADRTADALHADLEEYALEVASQIAGDDASIEQAPEPGLGYESAAARSGKTNVVIVRRPGLAAFPLLVARSAGVKPAELDQIVDGVVASLRSRPAGGG